MHIRELKNTAQLFKETAVAWTNSKTPRLGAALAYYTIFAVAPLFLIALSVAGFCFGPKAAQRELFGQVSGLVGRDGGEAIQALVAAANRPHAGIWASIAAVAALLAGATAVFVELQDALNDIWGVERKPGRGAQHFIKDRLLSFAMVLGIGFLLLVSLVLNAVLAAFGKFASNLLPEQHVFWMVVNFLASLGVITLLFAMILKILPDVQLAWGDVWVGAFVTALLFNFGKSLLGMYLGRSSMVSAYGAFGSFIVLLMWVYYSAQILYFGAEFTRVYAEKHRPSLDASRNSRLKPLSSGLASRGIS
jgi:membrane protein